MPDSSAINGIAFVMGSSLMLLCLLLVTGRKGRLDSRLSELSEGDNAGDEKEKVVRLVRATLPKMGAALVPNTEEERTRLQTRLIHAGLYGRQAMLLYLGVKLLLTLTPGLLGLSADLLRLTAFPAGLTVGTVLSIVGVIGPSFWLDYRKVKRQRTFRRALPDALDVTVICLEGGLSLPGAIRRVAMELRTAHPLLGGEFDIVQRETQLGWSTGEALRRFGERSDLEEIRSMASVITQSERFGASLVKAFRVHADTMREKRIQHAEEMAQKAAIKILFPTILFIFPAMFIVILGPAAIQIITMLDQMIGR